jgi:hypothetical protein
MLGGSAAFLLTLARQSIVASGDFHQSISDVEHASGFGHSAIRDSLRSQVSDRSFLISVIEIE